MPSPASIYALAALFAGAAATATAQSGDPIHACVTKASGKLRIVAVAGQCKASETALEWNQAPARPVLVGFTTAPILGGAGIFEWTRACAAEFAAARACQVGELVLDASPPAISSPEDFAWVLPNNGDSGQLIGLTPAGGVTCAASESSSAAGLVMNGHGFFGFRVCSDVHRVACCAPPQ